MHLRNAFTLIELLVVIAIIAILSIVVVLTLNPAQLLMQGRDSNRLSDMASMNSVLGIYSAQGGSSFGTANTVYVSVPDPAATSTAGDQCQGLGLLTLPATYSYHCAPSSTYRNVNGTGWIPVNFTTLAAGSPIGALPQDPINTSSSRLYYTYETNGTQYEVTSVMESQKYQLGGSNDVISNDGGILASVYEKGSTTGLEPLDYGDSTLVGYWTFDEGQSSTAYDYSGNGNNGTLYNSPQWVSGKIGAGALSFNNSNTYVQLAAYAPFAVNSKTVSFWADPAGVQTYNDVFSNGTGNYYIAFNGSAPGNVFVSYSNGSSVQIANPIASGVVTVGTWAYYTVVFNVASSNVVIQVYINGQLVGTQSRTDGYASVVGGLYLIGAFSASNSVFNGSLDDIRFYNRALSATQIAAMYSGGK